MATMAHARGDGPTTWTEKLGLDTEPVPVSGFTSAEYFELERERIFRRCWLAVGRDLDIPNPGDFFVKDIPACDASVIVIRGTDGRIRAFHNVCSHRGNQVLWQSQGSCKAIRCRYHGWIYGTDGSLRGVPDESQFFDFDKSQHGLVPVSLDTWGTFLFVNLDPDPAETLHEYLGELVDATAGYPFAHFDRCYSWGIDLECNWKIVKDAFCEMYHTPFIHALTAGDGLIGKEGEHNLCDAVNMRAWRRAGQFSVFGTQERTMTPVEQIADRSGASVRTGALEIPPGVNPTNDPFWRNDITSIFPHFGLVLFPALLLAHNFIPVTVNRSRWEFFAYWPTPHNASQRFSQEWAKVHLRDAVLEDVATVEKTHKALRSGVKTHMVLQDQEALVRFSHKTIQDLAGPYPPAEKRS